MQPVPGETRLAAHDLACRRGERILFRGLSLELARGEALQIAGPNGIGKTSLMRILAGLLRPFTGSVEACGAMALLDGHSALDPNLPLGKALEFWSGMDGGEADLARLGLGNLEDVPVRYLSTGQTKRAALARMMAQGAPIWLLDEPLNGLDTQGTALVEELVAEHCAGGGIAVVASHQPIALPDGQALALENYLPSRCPPETASLPGEGPGVGPVTDFAPMTSPTPTPPLKGRGL